MNGVATADPSERIHDTHDLAIRLHGEFPLVRLGAIAEIIRGEQHAALEDEDAPAVSPAATAGAVELVARRRAIAELETMLHARATPARVDRDLWIAEDDAESYAGLLERIGGVFYTSDALGRRTGAHLTEAAATAVYPGVQWRRIYSASAA